MPPNVVLHSVREEVPFGAHWTEETLGVWVIASVVCIVLFVSLQMNTRFRVHPFPVHFVFGLRAEFYVTYLTLRGWKRLSLGRMVVASIEHMFDNVLVMFILRVRLIVAHVAFSHGVGFGRSLWCVGEKFRHTDSELGSEEGTLSHVFFYQVSVHMIEEIARFIERLLTALVVAGKVLFFDIRRPRHIEVPFDEEMVVHVQHIVLVVGLVEPGLAIVNMTMEVLELVNSPWRIVEWFTHHVTFQFGTIQSPSIIRILRPCILSSPAHIVTVVPDKLIQLLVECLHTGHFS
uniref:Uncharacterized protein n=1 Tax=Cacopsylla melanoneura TaxID=428564 RepID=A0A8D8ZVB6_9HEMI